MSTIVIPNFNTQKTMAGLNTYTYTIVNTALHTCRMMVSHHQASNLTASITQSGSVSATLATVTVQPVALPNSTGQSSVILTVVANCVSGDVISFVLTSSNANDQQLNNVKTDMIVTQGLTP